MAQYRRTKHSITPPLSPIPEETKSPISPLGRDGDFMRASLLPLGGTMEPFYSDRDYHDRLIRNEVWSFIKNWSSEDTAWSIPPLTYRSSTSSLPGDDDNDELDEESLCNEHTSPDTSTQTEQEVYITSSKWCLLAILIASLVLLHNQHAILTLVQPIAPIQQSSTSAASLSPLQGLPQQPMNPLGSRKISYSYNVGILQWEQVGEDLEHFAIKRLGRNRCSRPKQRYGSIRHHMIE